MNLMTQSEAARMLGISRQAVSDAIKRGKLTPAAGADGRYLYRKGRPLLAAVDVARYRIGRRTA